MMRYDFFPDREADMVNWGNRFANVLTQTVGHFGVPPATLAEFIELQLAFAQAYALTTTRQTRTSNAVAEKNQARKAMERAARFMAKFLSGNRDLNDGDRSALGLTIPRTPTRNVKPPTAAPQMIVTTVAGNRLSIALVDAERSTRRARPDNARGAVLVFAVGDHPPATKEGWTYLKSTTKTRLTVMLDASLPLGTRVWFCSAWASRRSHLSPWSQPVSAVLLGDVNLKGVGRKLALRPRLGAKEPLARESATQAA